MADGIPYPPSATALHFGAYAPGVQPRGDIYAGEGIAGLGQGIAQAVGNYQRNRAAHEQRDAIVNFLAENYPETLPASMKTKGDGQAQPAFDALERYHAAGENDKNKMMLQAYTAYTDMIRRQKLVEDMARAKLYQAQATALTAQPSITPFHIQGQDDVYALTQPGHPAQLLNKPQPVSPYSHTKAYRTDPQTGQPVEVGEYDENGKLQLYHDPNALAALLGGLMGVGGAQGGGAQPGVAPTPSGVMPPQQPQPGVQPPAAQGPPVATPRPNPQGPVNLPKPGDVIPGRDGHRYQYQGPPNSQAAAQDPGNWQDLGP